MSTLTQDVRFALRALLKRPAASAIIIAMLAVGIGVNTTFFSFLNDMVLKPLPFEDPERLVILNESQPKIGRFRRSVSAPNLRDWQEENRVFAGIAPFIETGFNLSTEENPERVQGASVSASLFPLLGITLVLGRSFSPEEDRPGGPAVALISDAVWKRRFDGDPRVLGETLRLDDRPYNIVGVMPAGMRFPNFAEIWTPLALDRSDTNRARRYLQVIARLAPGVAVEQAQEEMTALGSRLEARFPEANTGWSARVWPLRDAWLPPVTQFSTVAAQGAVFFVLLIVCANVASLMLAHATARRQETALRGALGANRWKLVRLFLAESLLLALSGGLLGCILGQWGVEWLKSLVLVPIPYWLGFEIDRAALLFALGLAILSAFVFGLAPALRGTGRDLFTALKSGARTDDTSGGNRLRSALVVSQFAMSVVLLVGALLLIKSFVRLQQMETGYEPRRVLTLRLSLTGERLQEPAARVPFLEEILAEVSKISGVVSVGLTNFLPSSNQGYRSVTVEAEGRPAAGGEERVATYSLVSARYTEALSVPVVAGRVFTTEEVREGREVALINRGLAEELWPGEEGLGRKIRLGGASLTVVGTVGDVQPAYMIGGLDRWPRAQVYAPYGRQPPDVVTLAVRTGVDPAAAAPAVTAAIRRVDGSVPIYAVETLDHVLSVMHWVPRIWSQQFSILAVIALAIAALGAYGVTSYAASRRVRELGIRLALGATRGEIMRFVVRQGVGLGALGVGLGLVAAIPLSRLLGSLLHDVSARDPVVFAGVAVLLGLVSVVASYIPARRASSLDVTLALRAE